MYLKSIIKRGLLGITIGTFLSYSVLILMSIGKAEMLVDTKILITQFVISGTTGFYLAAVSVVFDVEHWSLLRQTITHFFAMLPMLPVAYFAGWMQQTIKGIIFYSFFFIVFYVIQWIIFYNYWKGKAEELNQQLTEFQQQGPLEERI